MTRIYGVAAALQWLGDASRLLVTSQPLCCCCSHSVSTTKVLATITLCSLHTPHDCNNMEGLAARLVREWLRCLTGCIVKFQCVSTPLC
jgi:hypothetical protein